MSRLKRVYLPELKIDLFPCRDEQCTSICYDDNLRGNIKRTLLQVETKEDIDKETIKEIFGEYVIRNSYEEKSFFRLEYIYGKINEKYVTYNISTVFIYHPFLWRTLIFLLRNINLVKRRREKYEEHIEFLYFMIDKIENLSDRERVEILYHYRMKSHHISSNRDKYILTIWTPNEVYEYNFKPHSYY